MITGMRLISAGLYNNLVISGADLISSFIYSGSCLSRLIVRHRADHLMLHATVLVWVKRPPLLSCCDAFCRSVQLSGGSKVHDANHISGPPARVKNCGLQQLHEQADTKPGEMIYFGAWNSHPQWF
jgi:3-oxoacyl-[acyl-carrier-protein] synthase-1